MFPAGATEDRAPSRLGSSMRVKGEILGNEDLDIDGPVEGLVHIDERKLTVGLQQSWQPTSLLAR
jgi:cytoskeletal protein CcmA (bactofilin family)